MKFISIKLQNANLLFKFYNLIDHVIKDIKAGLIVCRFNQTLKEVYLAITKLLCLRVDAYKAFMSLLSVTCICTYRKKNKSLITNL
jgi:hypothetical protein